MNAKKMDGLCEVVGDAYATEVVMTPDGRSVRIRMAIAGRGDGAAIDLSPHDAWRLAHDLLACVREHATALLQRVDTE